MLWLRDRHPKEPPSWRADVRDAEERVARWARGELEIAPGEVIFEDLWVVHKVTFSRRQHLKCAYCELELSADGTGGHIDHYRPKAHITRLLDDPATWGDEVEGHNSRDPKKRRQTPRVCRGYWWLAYAWRNYLLSCSTCNEKWKGNLFPIEGGHRCAPTLESYAKERALLLDPYGEVDPAEHLAFDKIGLVTPRDDSKIGLETIRTCHLARETLRSSRQRAAEAAWPRMTSVLKELASAGLDDRRLQRVLGRLLRTGAPSEPHAGMVRILWAQRDTFGVTWEQLRALHAAL